MSDALILTLGHGSSAIYIKDDKVVNGYQTERISGDKSDSRFPAMAIEEIMRYDNIQKDIPIMVSHWSPSGNIYSLSKKHWNPEYLKREFPDSETYFCNVNFTHHMAHAMSAMSYTGPMPDDTWVIVADGFGNCSEVLSIYKIHKGVLTVVDKIRGYCSSLGLLYQYATDYVGMKMNQDEWKMNAYACCIDKSKIPSLKAIANIMISEILRNHQDKSVGHFDDPVVFHSSLSYTHLQVTTSLSRWFKPENVAEIAFTMQKVVERVLGFYISGYGMKRVVLVGGVFMNVQLNEHICNLVDTIAVMPLSGDCGAGLGIFKSINPSFKLNDSFCWGKRSLIGLEAPNLEYSHDVETDLITLLDKGLIVNVVRSNMEFGERAYCNTSTIAAPIISNAMKINELNSRNHIMPMAPVMTRDQYHSLFENTEKVHKSVEHMIMSLRYKGNSDDLSGVRHYIPDLDAYTGRPQVVDEDHYMHKVCSKFGPLINTSFNAHGRPICYSKRDIYHSHMNQVSKDNKSVITLVEI